MSTVQSSPIKTGWVFVFPSSCPQVTLEELEDVETPSKKHPIDGDAKVWEG